MPQTVVKNGDQLGIRLDRTDQTYIPGETISGHVFRKSPIVTSKATLQISLHGRSKSRMVANHGHLTSTHRGRFDLVKSPDYTKTIFRGPLHIPADGTEQRWPFAIQIPTHIDVSALESGVIQEQSYLSLDPADVLTHRLPPTFSAENYQYLSGMSAFVEYFLQAELKTSSRGSSNAMDATLPFKMLCSNSEQSNIASCLKISIHTQSISSPTLIAEQTNAGAVQHATTLLGEPKYPLLLFDVQVQIPTVLQINSRDPVPFLVSAIPDLDRSSGNVQYSSQEMCITHVSMNIVARTEVKCLARKGTRQADVETQIDLRAEDAYCRYGNSLLIPWKDPITDGELSQENTRRADPLNVGEKIGLRLERREDLFATFQTYNIQHTHRLKWELIVQVAGGNFGLFGEDDVKILTSTELERSTEWIQPPSEDQLPSFSDHQETLLESDAGRMSQDRERRLGGVGGLSRLWAF